MAYWDNLAARGRVRRNLGAMSRDIQGAHLKGDYRWSTTVLMGTGHAWHRFLGPPCAVVWGQRRKLPPFG
ncbi:hypothetical protein KVR01_001972 [Diaporthe batatas]|uniref:uncharacterized protein n=1 Tax=Diaporthe batatas TaxID=748121 RepID=UPI001D054C91|nr:uncharacterized protein KVR01_001972 [Diaporthe batatas]KAG8169223.1 hypothetical protein KVR01_001972 [Diaporthe batatas]